MINPKIVIEVVKLVIAAIPLICKIVENCAPNSVKSEDIESGKFAVEMEACEDEIKPENYDSTSDYIKAIRESIENDPAKKEWVDEKMENMSFEDREAYKMSSVIMACNIITETMNVDDVNPEFLGKANAMELDDEETIAFIEELAENGVSTTDANNYFEGKLKGDDFEKAGNGIKAAIEKLYPEMKTDEQKTEMENTMFEKINAKAAETENN